MVLDKDLNVLGEHVFDEFQVHAISNIFVGEEGLYLSLNNENSPDYDEDHLRYMVVRFEVEKLEVVAFINVMPFLLKRIEGGTLNNSKEKMNFAKL